MSPTKVVIMGHSFVARLRAYAKEDERRNMSLDPAHHTVEITGRSGLGIPQLYTVASLWIRKHNPHLVIIDIGTNDIDSQAPAVKKLAHKLFSIGRKMIAIHGVSHVEF